MKKALVNTRVSVKLRKSEYRDEWYLYVESYPVFQSGKDTPQRVREYLNRTITTPRNHVSMPTRSEAYDKRNTTMQLYMPIPMQNRRSSWNAPEVISLSTSTMCSEQGMPIALILSLSTGGECMNY